MSLFEQIYTILLTLTLLKLGMAALQARTYWSFYTREKTSAGFRTCMSGMAFARHFGLVAALATVTLFLPFNA